MTKTAKTRQHPRTGVIEALSSNGHTVYQVTIGEQTSCTCPAGRQGRSCYHVTTAAARYAALWPVPTSFRRPVRKARVSDLYGPEL